MEEKNINIENEQEKPSLEGSEPKELAAAIAEVLDVKKAHNIQVLHVEKKTVIADYFVICTGNSTTQIKALADEVEYKIGLRGVSPLRGEGRENGSWALIDYGSVIVHIFSREARDFYKIEKLWGDAEKVEVADLVDNKEN